MRTSTNPFISFLKDLTYWGLEVFGKYYSCYRGIVSDNEDPANLCRLKIMIPQVNGPHIQNYWAYPRGVYSGKDYGFQVLPQKDDLVWVEFEGGHPEVPIWSHGYRGKKEVPSDKDLRDVNTYWFKSPKGNLVLINDTKKTIRIKLSIGNTIEINEQGISLGKETKSTYSGVLGEELVDIITKQMDIQNQMSGLLSNAITASSVALSPSLLHASMTPELMSLNIKMASLNAELQKILSKKITLE